MRLGTRGQRAGAGPGRAGRRRPRRRRDRHDRDLGTTRGEHRATRRASSARSSEALLDGEVDLAVHSAKDLPTRASRRARRSSASRARGPGRRLRRRRRLARRRSRRERGSAPRACAAAPSCSPLRPDLEVVEMRGNVDTRLAKLGERRARRHRARRGRPAPARPRRRDRLPLRRGRDDARRRARAALALEAPRRATRRGGRRRATITDREALVELTAERAAVAALDANCDTPVGVQRPPRGRAAARSTASPACPTAASGSATRSGATRAIPARSASCSPSGWRGAGAADDPASAPPRWPLRRGAN